MDGVKRLAAAAIDPRALAGFFKLLQKEQAGALNLPAFLATHPDLGQRIQDVESAAKRSGFTKTAPFALSWPDVQKHAGRAQKTEGE
jgi:beta-barrel assembly-enhancing protease